MICVWLHACVSVKVRYLKVKFCFCEVLVQSRGQVLSCGQDDAAERGNTQHTNSCCVLLSSAWVHHACKHWSILYVSKLSVQEVGGCVSLAGEEPHDVPVAGENTELHQISKHTQNLQQELLKKEEKRRGGFEWQFPKSTNTVMTAPSDFFFFNRQKEVKAGGDHTSAFSLNH